MPKGPRKFQFLFDARGLTRYGGLLLFQRFCKSLRLRHFLQQALHWPSYSHRSYPPVDLFLTHLFTLVAGIGRIENTQTLIHNGLIPPILGLTQFPHRDTLRSFLWRFQKEHLESLVCAHEHLRAELFTRFGPSYSAIIDADTTILTVFGHQETTAMGFNPKYPGKRSYAPLILSEGKTGLSLGLQLRAGNVHGSTHAWQLIKERLQKLPSSIARSRTRLRMDSGFYSREMVQKLDAEKMGYVIVARMTPALKRKMVSSQYDEFAKGWQAAEFSYPLCHWEKQHRFIAIRRPSRLEPEGLQRHLFTFKHYTYHRALVSNLDLTPPACWRFYCDRAFQELLLREFKDSYSMAKIPTRSFWANATYMEMILWAYDLVLAFQFLCLPKEVQHWNISTLRRQLWCLPAEWVNRSGHNVLRLPLKYPHQSLFLNIEKVASHLKPLI